MLIPSKLEGYRAGRRVYPGGKGGGVASPDPEVGRALMKQSETGDRLLDFVMKSYDDQKPLIESTNKLNAEQSEFQLASQKKADQRGDDQYAFYQSTGRPVVEQSLDDAKNWDSEENLQKARANAQAGVESAFAGAAQQNLRRLQSLGINPNSGKFLALNNDLMAQKAVASAGAQNAEVQDRKLQAAGMRTQAANIAQGFPGQSMNFSGQGSSMGATGASIYGQNLGNVQRADQMAQSGIGSAGSIYGSNASGYTNLYNSQVNAQQARNQSDAGLGNLVGTIGSAAIMRGFADGGPIKGPGTGTSDSIPAINASNGSPIAVSNGEYIIPEDVVRAKGVEFFDKLKEKYHKPVNVGRGVQS